MKISIRWKLTVLFVVVVLVSASITSAWLHQAVRHEFSDYVQRLAQRQAKRMLPFFTSYYKQHHSWNEVGKDFRRRIAGTPFRRSPMQGILLSKTHLILLDENGRVVWDSLRPVPPVIRPPKKAITKDSIPIVVDGKTVGKLIVLIPDIRGIGKLETQFLASVDHSLIASTLLALVLALLFGGVLSSLIARPLRSLVNAARDVAKGQFSRRVKVSSSDEIGDLEAAFNTMASTLEANEAQRRKLLTDIAHELRNPLSVIRGNLEAILDGVYEPNQQNLAPVYEETILLERLVSDLRELSLAETGNLRLEKEDVDLGDIAKQAANFFGPQADEKGIDLVVTTSPRLPHIQGDPQRLRQILNNLISNAMRYTPDGGKIEVNVRLLGGRPLQVAASVRDTGPGIPPEDLPHIFDRFFLGEPSHARRSGGTGLGLVIAKELVEAHGGHIWIDSAPGKGTTVTFAIPVTGKTSQTTEGRRNHE